MRFLFVLFLLCISPGVHADGTSPMGTELRQTNPAAVQNAADQLGRIFPLIRNTDDATHANDETAIISAPLAGDLVITYVIDAPTQTTTLTTDMASFGDMPRPELHKVAMQNLMQKSRNAVITGSDEGLYFLALDGKFENALLLDQELWHTVTSQVGPIIMAVPAPDLVLFVPQYDHDALDIMQAVLASQSMPVSAQLFTWNKGTWVVLPEN